MNYCLYDQRTLLHYHDVPDFQMLPKENVSWIDVSGSGRLQITIVAADVTFFCEVIFELHLAYLCVKDYQVLSYPKEAYSVTTMHIVGR